MENDNTIFISQANLVSVCEASLDQNKTPRKNVLAGEVLNPGEQRAQRVRTGIIEIYLMTCYLLSRSVQQGKPVYVIHGSETFFNLLKTSKKVTLFHRGSFYSLTPQHKVVIAQNPITYGGNR